MKISIKPHWKNWVSMSLDVKGEIYEGLQQKNEEDIKSVAGQYFTPCTLIKAKVACVCSESGKMIADPLLRQRRIFPGLSVLYR